MKLVINVGDEKVDVLTPLASSSVTDALGYTPMDSSQRGATNGVASLTSGKVPASELPSYVDDVIEGYYYNSNFYSDSAHTQLITGEAGKIYVDLSANSSYRYTGSAYVEISQSITVDNAMSTTSTNPVQNRIITEAINNMRILISGTVNISAPWASNGATVTCTKGTETVTGTISASACTLYLPRGQWTITVTDQSTTASETLDVLLGHTYSVEIWADDYHKIQSWVRNGTIQSHYSIGDQITVTRGSGNIIFDVVAFDVATPADTTKTHSMTLMAHYLLDDYMMFDNKEPNNSNSDRKSYGNNRYAHSNIRLWLNSNGVAGSWWTAQHSADAAPDYATTKAGFMNGFDTDFLAVLGLTKFKVVKNTVTDGGGYEELTDTFYLPSKMEVGLGAENSIEEGTQFPYFSSNAKRIKYREGTTSAEYWWLRTPYSLFSGSVRPAGSYGSLYDDYAYDAYGVAPACNII